MVLVILTPNRDTWLTEPWQRLRDPRIMQTLMFYLSKTLPALVMPLGLAIVILLLAFVTRNRWLTLSALLILYFSSLPPVGRFMIGVVESGQERRLADRMDSADAVVVLSGGRTLAPGSARVSEWNDADRFFGGIELFAAGKAPLLVFTGGTSPWEGDIATEGEVLAKYAKAWGVPEERILLTGPVQNTREEADKVASLLRSEKIGDAENGDPRILLVTSAFHMSRATTEFGKRGLSVRPYPVDFMVSSARHLNPTDFFPSPQALLNTTIALRELMGRLIFKIF